MDTLEIVLAPLLTTFGPQLLWSGPRHCVLYPTTSVYFFCVCIHISMDFRLDPYEFSSMESLHQYFQLNGYDVGVHCCC